MGRGGERAIVSELVSNRLIFGTLVTLVGLTKFL